MFREEGEQMGFGSVFSGPLVRSSYRADEQQLRRPIARAPDGLTRRDARQRARSGSYGEARGPDEPAARHRAVVERLVEDVRGDALVQATSRRERPEEAASFTISLARS